jgi:hypothetical protein
MISFPVWIAPPPPPQGCAPCPQGVGGGFATAHVSLPSSFTYQIHSGRGAYFDIHGGSDGWVGEKHTTNGFNGGVGVRPCVIKEGGVLPCGPK